jgi:hypothetical protein
MEMKVNKNISGVPLLLPLAKFRFCEASLLSSESADRNNAMEYTHYFGALHGIGKLKF